MFKCDKCGECCKNLNKSSIYDELHDGDGVCRYLINDICSIYENRPLLCRVDESYEVLFKDKMSKSRYYKLNYEFCDSIKKQLL